MLCQSAGFWLAIGMLAALLAGWLRGLVSWWAGGDGLGGYVHAKLESVSITFDDTLGNQKGCLFSPH